MSEQSSLLAPAIDDTQGEMYLIISVEKEVFGIDIRYVTSIIGLQKISMLPETPDYVKGVINLRGKIIPVIDMRLRFKKSPAKYNDRTCIIVIDIQRLTVGLIVDSVDEVIPIPSTAVVPVPSYKAGSQNRCIKGIGKVGDDIRMLLDCEKLFMSDERQMLCQIKM
jgi:purine-binding chemotaxis protein CheW